MFFFKRSIWINEGKEGKCKEERSNQLIHKALKRRRLNTRGILGRRLNGGLPMRESGKNFSSGSYSRGYSKQVVTESLNSWIILKENKYGSSKSTKNLRKHIIKYFGPFKFFEYSQTKSNCRIQMSSRNSHRTKSSKVKTYPPSYRTLNSLWPCP